MKALGPPLGWGLMGAQTGDHQVPLWELPWKRIQCGGTPGPEAGLSGSSHPHPMSSGLLGPPPSSTQTSSSAAKVLSAVSFPQNLLPSPMETHLLWAVPPKPGSPDLTWTPAPHPAPGYQQ